MAIRILVGMDTPTDSGSLTWALETVLGFEVAGVIGLPRALAAAVEKFHPEVVVLRLADVSKPWLDAVAELSRTNRTVGFVALTDTVPIDEILSMLKAGIKSIIPLLPQTDDLGTAIREVSNGKMFIPSRKLNGV